MYLLRKPSISCSYEMHMVSVVLNMCVTDIDKEELSCVLLLCVADILEKGLLLPSNMMRIVRSGPAMENRLIFLFEKQSK